MILASFRGLSQLKESATPPGHVKTAAAQTTRQMLVKKQVKFLGPKLRGTVEQLAGSQRAVRILMGKGEIRLIPSKAPWTDIVQHRRMSPSPPEAVFPYLQRQRSHMHCLVHQQLERQVVPSRWGPHRKRHGRGRRHLRTWR